jgi:preprotein translocase subunit SecE
MAKSAVTQIMDEDRIGGKIRSWPQRVKGFYTDVRTEMKKVTAPSFKEVRATTIVVVITVALFGVYFWIVDTAIGRGVNEVFKYFRH